MRYVALLRGINVGGNNKIAMAELRAYRWENVDRRTRAEVSG